ncbi:MAG: PAS domain S-box protein [Thermodesulfobacteriota bacterium]|nr:PAS domain S-box protein [Thermodesulfobacteriota bacterium]
MKLSFDQEPDELIQFVRGREARTPLNIAIVGGGEACYNLLRLLDKNRSSRLNMKILGVADIDPEAPGLAYAKKLGLFASTDFRELYGLKGLNLLIELTGSSEVRESILETKPTFMSMIDRRGVRFLWDLIHFEIEKGKLEKKQQQEYEESKNKQTQLILDSLPYRIMVVNLDMTIDKVNQTFLRDFGLSYDEVVGRHCHEIRYGLDRPCRDYGKRCYLEEVKNKGEIVSTIHEYIADDGEERFDVITVSPIFDEQGRMTQSLEASRDVTERIKLEREVQKSNIFFQNVIQSTVDGIVVVDTKGNVLIFNEGMERLTGYSSEELIKEGHLSSFYDIDVAKENMERMRLDRHGPVGKLNPTSMHITSKSGQKIPVTLSASIMTVNGEEIGSVGVFTDMREILKMRKDLEDVHFQLVQSEKIASVGRMAAGVAHEINNPLSGVLIYAELLKERIRNDYQFQEDIQEIIHQTLRCKKIVSELLEFSRQSMGKITSFSLDHLINNCLNLLINQALFQNIAVNLRIDPGLPNMLGDMGQLQQVFSNLFINAAHAMDGKGTLGIEASLDAGKDCFVIKVSDTGPGIPEELQDKVFDIFFTTKPVGKGTGLGLSISQNVVNLHGGTLQFECPIGGGTIFTVELPLESAEPSVDEPVFVGLEENGRENPDFSG